MRSLFWFKKPNLSFHFSGEVNKLIADVDGEYLKAKIEVDVYYEKQELLAKAIKAEGIAEAKGIQEMNDAMGNRASCSL